VVLHGRGTTHDAVGFPEGRRSVRHTTIPAIDLDSESFVCTRRTYRRSSPALGTDFAALVG